MRKIAYVEKYILCKYPSIKLRAAIQSKQDAKENSKEDPCSRHKGCASENLCKLEMKGPVAHHPQFSNAPADQRG